MKPVTHVTFYQALGALLLLADVGVVTLVVLRGVPIDRYVVGLAALPLIGALALLRPTLLDRGVRAVTQRFGGGHDS